MKLYFAFRPKFVCEATRATILSGTKTEKALYQQYRNKLRTHNANLARLSQLVGVTLTSYVARHTWATTAYGDGIELPLISKALGHAKPSTTLLYILYTRAYGPTSRPCKSIAPPPIRCRVIDSQNNDDNKENTKTCFQPLKK